MNWTVGEPVTVRVPAAVVQLFCSACRIFHPVRCFHRNAAIARGYHYACKLHRRSETPLGELCPKCGCERRHRWHVDRCPGRVAA